MEKPCYREAVALRIESDKPIGPVMQPIEVLEGKPCFCLRTPASLSLRATSKRTVSSNGAEDCAIARVGNSWNGTGEQCCRLAVVFKGGRVQRGVDGGEKF